MRGIDAVATSGGRDSTALLHATAVAAQAQDLQVLALHIHHGLQPDADAWFDQLDMQKLSPAWRAILLEPGDWHVGLGIAPLPSRSDKVKRYTIFEYWAR